MVMKDKQLYKENEGDKIWWVYDEDDRGTIEFTFDGKKIFNLFRDYPYKLNKKEIEIFKEEQPFWAEFFDDRG